MWRMPDSSASEPAPRSSAAATPSGRHSPHGLPERSSLVMAVVAALAVLGIALSAWALIRPPGGADSAPQYSDAQTAEAKSQTCRAFNTVRQGVFRNTNIQVPGGEADVSGSLAVAANARISLNDGGQYLLARLAPATPTELADAVRSFANGLMDIGAAATAGMENVEPEQAKRLTDADAASTTIGQLCA